MAQKIETVFSKFNLAAGAPDLTHENCEDDGKLLVKRGDLWHADPNLYRSSRKKLEQFCCPASVSIRLADGKKIICFAHLKKNQVFQVI